MIHPRLPLGRLALAGVLLTGSALAAAQVAPESRLQRGERPTEGRFEKSPERAAPQVGMNAAANALLGEERFPDEIAPPGAVPFGGGMLALPGDAMPRPIGEPSPRQRFLQENPGSALYHQNDGRLTRVYGAAFSTGATPIESAERFRLRHAGLFGVRPEHLVLEGPFEDKRTVQPILWDPDRQEFRFFGVYYAQKVSDLPVHTGVIKMLVRNEPGFPLVLAAADVRPVGPNPEGIVAQRPAIEQLDLEQFAGRALDQFRMPPAITAIEPVVWAGVDNEFVVPRVGVRFEAEGGTVFDPANYRKFRYITDPQTGEILFQENLILHQAITGTIDAIVTQGIGADICGGVAPEPLPYARVTRSGQNFFANSDGFFSIPGTLTGPVTISSLVRGQFFVVNNQSAPNGQVFLTVEPGSSENVLLRHNADNPDQLSRAEVNAYLHSNIVRDYALSMNPQYPVIANQTQFAVNVNIDNNCNAFYNGSSINFYTSGGGCSNSAASTVVYHEYGHHLINVGGSGQGQYGEGMSDSVAVVITDSPQLGLGFQNNCGSPLRSAVNNVQYPCDGAIHSCGRTLSGSIWDTRQAMVASNVSNYRQVLGNLTINSILLHTGTLITPQITIDFLTLDDDDGNILNGTPHYAQINQGFSAHNMPAPPLQLVSFEYPQGLPDLASPDGTTSFPVRVVGLGGTPTGTVNILWRAAGGSWQGAACPPIGDDTYLVTIPASTCGGEIQYYLRATLVNGPPQTSPPDGINDPFTAFIANEVVLVLEDTFSAPSGWTVGAPDDDATAGIWVRVNPNGTTSGGAQVQPNAPFVGSACWVTGQHPGGGAGANDVDNGKTTLFSPVFDLSGVPDGNSALASYWRWYSNGRGAGPNNDVFVVDVSPDAGATWVNLEVVGPTPPEVDGGWFFREWNLGLIIPLTDSVQFRFVASDYDPQSLVEAAVDLFSIREIVCGSPILGDINGDGRVDGADLGLLLAAWGGSGPADLNGDGIVDGADLGLLLAAWEQ